MERVEVEVDGEKRLTWKDNGKGDKRGSGKQGGRKNEGKYGGRDV